MKKDKERKKIEKIVEDILHKILFETYEEDEYIIPMALLDEIEDYMGERILFMGIS